MNTLTTLGEWMLLVQQQTQKYSTHQEIKSYITRLQPKLRSTATGLAQQLPAQSELSAYGKQSLQKNSTVSGAECLTENETPLCASGKNNTEVR